MREMFYGATAFNSDLSTWDVGKVVNMDMMFWGVSAFNGNVSTWDVGNVLTWD